MTALVVSVCVLLLSVACESTAPTVVILATSEDESLRDYAGIARHLPGWRVVSMDLPAHGENRRDGETRPLAAWRARMDTGEDIVGQFRRDLSDLLDGLPSDRIALVGISRGGFLALHGAADPRVDAVVAFMPVTELRALAEFAGASPDYDRWNVTHLTVRQPVFLTISEDDPRVSTGAAVAAAHVLRASLVTTPGIGHIYGPDAERAAADWLRHRLH